MAAVADGLAGVGLPLQHSRRPASTPAARRRTSASATDGEPAVREGARRGRAQRRPAVPLLPARSSRATSATSGRSRRCGAASSTRRWSRWRPRTSASARRACGPSPRPSRTATCSPTTPSQASRSIALDPSEVTDDVLGGIWRLVGELRRHRIAHRDLRLANVFLDDDGEVWLIDFGFSEMAASDLLLATDVAELVASSSVYVGAERAVAQADGHRRRRHARSRARGPAAAWALVAPTRSALKAQPGPSRTCATRLAGRARPLDEPLVVGRRRRRAGDPRGCRSNAARRPSISPAEARVFHAVNGCRAGSSGSSVAPDAARQPRRRHGRRPRGRAGRRRPRASPSASCWPRCSSW